MSANNLKQLLNKLEAECPLIPHTGAGRLFSMVRRMKAEKELGIPINSRSNFAISVKLKKSANEMNEQEWESFYKSLCDTLKKDYLSLYETLFSK